MHGFFPWDQSTERLTFQGRDASRSWAQPPEYGGQPVHVTFGGLRHTRNWPERERAEALESILISTREIDEAVMLFDD